MNIRVLRGLRLFREVAIAHPALQVLTQCTHGLANKADRGECQCPGCRHLRDLGKATAWLAAAEPRPEDDQPPYVPLFAPDTKT